MKKWITSTVFTRKKPLLYNAVSDSSDHEHIFHVITQLHTLISWNWNTLQKKSISIWEEAVNKPTQPSSLQLLCTIITKLCHKIF